MSGTLMDMNPPPAALSEPLAPPASEPAATAFPAPSFIAMPERENPLLSTFVGPNGLYPGTRWLIYLALCGIILGVIGVITHFVHRPRISSVWWGLLPEAGVS